MFLQDKVLKDKQLECEDKIKAQLGLHEGLRNEVTDDQECNIVWDGIMCWPKATSGQTIYQPCASYLVGFDLNGFASKICTENGWWVHPSFNTTWTNYTNCGKERYVTMAPFIEPSTLHRYWVPLIKNISRIGYIVSFVSLVLACFILLCNRKLRCPRNIIHLHLFVSFLMRAFMALLKDNLLEEGVGFSDNIYHFTDDIHYTDTTHDWRCKVFTTFWQYFIMANYSWILMEGLYLHNLIFMPLCSDSSSVRLYAALGWTLPALFVVPWTLIRVFYEDTLCWTTHSNRKILWIIQIPIAISMVINLVLFLNITRVLLIKLQIATSYLFEHRISRYRKWAKSTLILMPLYGVHYAILLGLSYSENPTVETLWLFFDQLFASSQGLFVSFLYCMMNHEVIQVMKANWRSTRCKFVNHEETFDMWRKCENGTADDDPAYIATSVSRHI